MRMMFRLVCSAFVVISLSSCEASLNPETEAEISLIRESLPGIEDRCIKIILEDRQNDFPQDVRECFPMQERKRWTGLWYDYFESSTFCTEVMSKCPSETGNDLIWLTFADENKATRPSRYAQGKVYKVDFIGRRTQLPGAFGHYGIWKHEIVVEDVISIKQVNN